ncbi:MAG: YHS domain-containing protein [Thermoanaerobaculia bacterium]
MQAMRWMFLSAVTALLLVLAARASAGEESQKGQTMSMDEMMKGCREHHASVMKARDDAAAALARAKQANSMDEMRKDIEQAEKSLGEMKSRMSACTGMMDRMGGMHGGMMSGKGMMGEKGMMGGGMMSSEKKAGAKVTDPVCGMEVDPKTAPSASYNGKTYYFCSPEDKTKFEEIPQQYLNKKPA